MTESDPSSDDFRRGRYTGLIVAAVVVVLGVAAVLALSGVFESKKTRIDRDPGADNREGGCPCNCDRSTEMAAEVRALGGDAALREIDRSLATIAEREAAGYVTEAMIAHRLRLLDVEREVRRAGNVSAAPRERIASMVGGEHGALGEPLRAVGDGSLRVGMQLAVHGATIEWVRERQKPLRASFLLAIEIENASDRERVVKQPAIEASAPFPISRWYLRGESGEPWDGVLGARERRVVHVIGYVGEAVRPKTEIVAAVRFEAATFQLETRARARWDERVPSAMRL